MSFSSYVKQLSAYVPSSSIVLGLILGIAVFVAGEGSLDANLDFDFDFGGLDGLWPIFLLPLAALLVFLILSPLSYLVHRQLSKRSSRRVAADDSS